MEIKSLSNDKNLRLVKFEGITDDKINEKLKFGLRRVENIGRKGENAGYQHFLCFP